MKCNLNLYITTLYKVIEISEKIIDTNTVILNCFKSAI